MLSLLKRQRIIGRRLRQNEDPSPTELDGALSSPRLQLRRQSLSNRQHYRPNTNTDSCALVVHKPIDR